MHVHLEQCQQQLQQQLLVGRRGNLFTKRNNVLSQPVCPATSASRRSRPPRLEAPINGATER